MKSKATPRFWKLYGELPAHARKLAQKNYHLWQENHDHPSLCFKKLKGGTHTRFSVRVGDHYRAIGQIAGDTVEWVWNRGSPFVQSPSLFRNRRRAGLRAGFFVWF